MHELVKVKTGQLADFKPELTQTKILTLKAAIEHARDMEDWEAGQEAARWMVAEITSFVDWWDANVSVRESAGRKTSADLRSSLSADKAEQETGIAHQQVSRWRKELGRPGFELRGLSPAIKKFLNRSREAEGRAALQSGEMEWFTPGKYIELARDVLGGFDLDPASCEAAQQTVGAATYYTAESDGLRRPWKGRIWLNPPYSGALVKAFAEKLLDSLASGDVTAAIMLTNSYTETSWFHTLASVATAVCFTRGRIKFESPHGEKCSPTNGQAFLYFGDNLALFKEKFLDVGLVMVQA